MNCYRCNSRMTYGETTIAFERDDVAYLFRHVPAKICTRCGEELISEEVHQMIEQLTERSIEPGLSINVFDMMKIYQKISPQLA